MAIVLPGEKLSDRQVRQNAEGLGKGVARTLQRTKRGRAGSDGAARAESLKCQAVKCRDRLFKFAKVKERNALFLEAPDGEKRIKLLGLCKQFQCPLWLVVESIKGR